MYKENKCFYLNRIGWIILLFLGSIIFVVQMIFCIQHFYARPFTVSMNIHYNTSVHFPAVTICNRNQFRYLHYYFDKIHLDFNESPQYKYGIYLWLYSTFRITAADENNLYDALSTLYGTSDYVDIGSYLAFHNTNKEEMYKMLSHKKERMILGWGTRLTKGESNSVLRKCKPVRFFMFLFLHHCSNVELNTKWTVLGN